MKSRLTPFGLALAFAGTTFAAFNPIPITPGSYNEDVVVEKTATPALKIVTTATVDQGTNGWQNTWMEVGFDTANPLNGLPAPGTVITPPIGDVVLGGGANTVAGINTNNPSVANYSFRMPPSYTEPNGILIDTAVRSGTLTLTTPAAYTRLSFLGGGGNGGDVVGVIVNHQDGTVETYNPAPGVTNNAYLFGVPDWFSGTSNVALIVNERVLNLNFTYANVNGGNPRLYFRDIVLTNTTSPVTNIVLNYASGPASSHNSIMAVSGATTAGGLVQPIAVTGWTYDFVVEASATKRGRTVTATVLDGTNVWATTQSMDNLANTGNSWYEMGYNVNNPGNNSQTAPAPDPRLETTSGLPAAGSSVTNALGDHIYTMASSFAANNVCYLDPSNHTTATITLASPFPVAPTAPATASILSFLAAAGNGPVSPQVTINYQDGTSESTVLTIPDWFNASASVVWIANGRVAVDTAQLNSVRQGTQNPRLFNCDIALTKTSSAITNITLTYTNTGGRAAIFAVSGTQGPAFPSFVTQPTFRTVSSGTSVQFTASAIGNSTITYRWQKGTNGVFVDLSDGGKITGALTGTLSVNNADLSDAADYRCVATSSAGSVNGSSATLIILSPLPDVTNPGDPTTSFGGTLFGDGAVAQAIDNTGLKYGMNLSSGGVPSGLVVTPSMGRTIVTGLRLYPANDTTARDATSFKLEGSLDGGSTYALIVSNSISLSDTRNAANAALIIDPLTNVMTQALFANTSGYTTYRLTFNTYKGGSGQGSFQIAEIELLGVADTSGKPEFTQQPTPVVTYAGSQAFFTASANGNPTPGLFWRKGTNGLYVNVTDNANITGSQTGTLTINAAQAGDVADYVCVATNISGSVTSSIASLSLVSTNTDVTVVGDPISAFGGTDGFPNGGNGNAPSAIDDTSGTWQNGGSGLSASAGFAPFGGPVGLIVTPVVGTTRLVGLRIYTSTGNAERDPADYKLEGSNDGGTNYTLISQGPLALPLGRNNNALGIDPTQQPMQEILFNHNQAYAVYRLTFTHTRDDNAANSLQIADVEFLGVPAAPVPVGPTLSISYSAGKLTITATSPGQLYSTTNLTAPVWKSEGAISGSVEITPSSGEPTKFYQTR